MIVMSVGGFIIFAMIMLIANNENKYKDYL